MHAMTHPATLTLLQPLADLSLRTPQAPSCLLAFARPFSLPSTPFLPTRPGSLQPPSGSQPTAPGHLPSAPPGCQPQSSSYPFPPRLASKPIPTRPLSVGHISALRGSPSPGIMPGLIEGTRFAGWEGERRGGGREDLTCSELQASASIFCATLPGSHVPPPASTGSWDVALGNVNGLPQPPKELTKQDATKERKPQ